MFNDGQMEPHMEGAQMFSLWGNIARGVQDLSYQEDSEGMFLEVPKQDQEIQR